jgi:hypothetical protein
MAPYKGGAWEFSRRAHIYNKLSAVWRRRLSPIIGTLGQRLVRRIMLKPGTGTRQRLVSPALDSACADPKSALYLPSLGGTSLSQAGVPLLLRRGASVVHRKLWRQSPINAGGRQAPPGVCTFRRKESIRSHSAVGPGDNCPCLRIASLALLGPRA